MFPKIIFKIIPFLIFSRWATGDDLNVDFVETFTKDEKEVFFMEVARRIANETKPNKEEITVTNEKLDQHEEYVQRVMKEVRDSIKNKSSKVEPGVTNNRNNTSIANEDEYSGSNSENKVALNSRESKFKTPLEEFFEKHKVRKDGSEYKVLNFLRDGIIHQHSGEPKSFAPVYNYEAKNAYFDPWNLRAPDFEPSSEDQGVKNVGSNTNKDYNLERAGNHYDYQYYNDNINDKTEPSNEKLKPNGRSRENLNVERSNIKIIRLDNVAVFEKDNQKNSLENPVLAYIINNETSSGLLQINSLQEAIGDFTDKSKKIYTNAEQSNEIHKDRLRNAFITRIAAGNCDLEKLSNTFQPKFNSGKHISAYFKNEVTKQTTMNDQTVRSEIFKGYQYEKDKIDSNAKLLELQEETTSTNFKNALNAKINLKDILGELRLRFQNRFKTLKFVNNDEREKGITLKHLHRNKEEQLSDLVKTLSTLIKNDDGPLNNYDWLRTTVDIQTRLHRLIKICDQEIEGNNLKSFEDELFKYLVFIQEIAKKIHLERSSNLNILLDKIFFPESVDVFQLRDRNRVHYLKKYLHTMLDALNPLHISLRDIAVKSRPNRQGWLRDSKRSYLRQPNDGKYLVVLLHLSAVRLIRDLEETFGRLGDNFLDYIVKEKASVYMTAEEIAFELDILNALSKLS